MIELITANGLVFEIDWIGVAALDGVLRFSIKDVDIATIIQVFTVPENCEVLIRKFDEDEQIFEGYAVFRGVQINYDGSSIVALSKI